ncbi:hypothetical protein LTR36_004502 [Oleoguttula mirabilis]|uniref:DUF4048 domain-containing protein n=1 Tax=Oleoguttula mirabilis TaxID=1507867 RepID=A0AAV9JHF0_9PEZI|nr:hypothetical protein LTR36_004502 [Oleoguttula mirabilis]
MLAGKRKSRVAPIEVQHALPYTAAMAAKPSPVEHVHCPASPTHSTGSSGRASFQSHSRTISAATDSAPTRPNRFSLSFPVQPPGASSPTRLSQSPTRDAPAVVPEALASPTGPTDTTFLHAIATQERRVLELKEELQRAEADLNQLKRHWAQHEANKKRNDARRITKLEPLQATQPTVDTEAEADSANARAQQEMERRKALLSGGRVSNRTVFSGSRHTRTLSLLSPASGEVKPIARQAIPPPRKDSLSSTTKRSVEPDTLRHKRPALLARASTTPDLTTEVAETADRNIDLPDNLQNGIDHEILLRTGKKMANDFRDGLWTFFEDLRQATVGDEATQHQQVLPSPNLRRHNSTMSQASLRAAKKKDSKNSLRPGSRGSTITVGSGVSAETRRPSPPGAKKHAKSATQGALPDLANPGFWSEHGVASVQATPAKVKKSPSSLRGHAKTASKGMSIASSDAWDTWDDSPMDSRSSSAASEATTVPSTVSGPTSPRPSVDRQGDGARQSEGQERGKNDPLPWPALSKLGPATLRRTASHLMTEWEKSLTPSGQEDYLGLSAEAAATNAGRQRG